MVNVCSNRGAVLFLDVGELLLDYTIGNHSILNGYNAKTLAYLHSQFVCCTLQLDKEVFALLH